MPWFPPPRPGAQVRFSSESRRKAGGGLEARYTGRAVSAPRTYYAHEMWVGGLGVRLGSPRLGMPCALALALGVGLCTWA